MAVKERNGLWLEQICINIQNSQKQTKSSVLCSSRGVNKKCTVLEHSLQKKQKKVSSLDSATPWTTQEAGEPEMSNILYPTVGSRIELHSAVPRFNYYVVSRQERPRGKRPKWVRS